MKDRDLAAPVPWFWPTRSLVALGFVVFILDVVLYPAASAATFFLVISAAAGQAAHGVLHLLDGSTAAFAAASTQDAADNGQALGHAAHGVLHLLDGSTAAPAGLFLDGALGGGEGGGGPVEQVQDTLGGLTGGVKDNVKDEQDETQRH